METSPSKIPVGISSCLLGHSVRYDGDHTKNDNILQHLQTHFDFKPFCPEVESGMSIPRPPIQLRHTPQGIRCVRVENPSIDVTDQLQSSAEQQSWLEEICGFILKKNSPSCGIDCVKVYRNNDFERTGSGIFAQYLKKRYPTLPLEEEDRLCDPQLRENFIQRVTVLHRWKQLCRSEITVNQLQVPFATQIDRHEP